MFSQKMKMDQNDRTENEQILISRTCQKWGNDPLLPSLPSTSADQFKTKKYFLQSNKQMAGNRQRLRSNRANILDL